MCRKRALVMSVLSNQIQLDVSKIGVYHGISHGLEIMRIIICVSNRFQGTQVSDKPSCSKFKAAFFSKNCTRMWIIHFQIDFFLPSQWMGPCLSCCFIPSNAPLKFHTYLSIDFPFHITDLPTQKNPLRNPKQWISNHSANPKTPPYLIIPFSLFSETAEKELEFIIVYICIP